MPTHGRIAKLRWPGWLVTYRDGLPACRRLPIQVLTGPGVNQLRWRDQWRTSSASVLNMLAAKDSRNAEHEMSVLC